jgi:hypothetical protein
MAQETLYELYFAQVAGHIIDVRDIQHIGPTEQHTKWESTGDDGAYGDVPDGYQFQYAMKGTGEFQTFEVVVDTEEEIAAARDILVAAHAKLWLPYPDEEKADVVEQVESTVVDAGSVATEAESNV